MKNFTQLKISSEILRKFLQNLFRVFFKIFQKFVSNFLVKSIIINNIPKIKKIFISSNSFQTAVRNMWEKIKFFCDGVGFFLGIRVPQKKQMPSTSFFIYTPLIRTHLRRTPDQIYPFLKGLEANFCRVIILWNFVYKIDFNIGHFGTQRSHVPPIWCYLIEALVLFFFFFDRFIVNKVTSDPNSTQSLYGTISEKQMFRRYFAHHLAHYLFIWPD